MKCRQLFLIMANLLMIVQLVLVTNKVSNFHGKEYRDYEFNVTELD